MRGSVAVANLLEAAVVECASEYGQDALELLVYLLITAEHEEDIEGAVLVDFICLQLFGEVRSAIGGANVCDRGREALPECLLSRGAKDGYLRIGAAGFEQAQCGDDVDGLVK